MGWLWGCMVMIEAGEMEQARGEGRRRELRMEVR